MINKIINLHDEFPVLSGKATLTSYCISSHDEYPFHIKRKAMIVIPGGGYEIVSKREGEPVALKLIANGIDAFVLDYTVGQFDFPYPLVEVYAALAYIRRHAEEYAVDINHIGVIGFSAGGHLAASATVHRQDEYFMKMLNVSENDIEISACVLGYPVITMKAGVTHEVTKNLITHNKDELVKYYEVIDFVNKKCPPVFIWTTKHDTCVSSDNSLMFKNKLDKIGIKNELYMYENGDHGGSTCDELACDARCIEALGDAHEWVSHMIDFLKVNL